MRDHEDTLKDFVAEADEIIETLNQNLLAMEATEDKSAVPPNTINSIFRAAHTLKGMSGMVGLTKVSEISHRLEDMLDKLRMGKLGITPVLMDILFRGVELIRGMVESAAVGHGDNQDISAILTQIDAIESGGEGAGIQDVLATAGLDATITAVLTEYESHRLSENVKKGHFLHEISADFKLETFDTDLTELTGTLQTLGEVISTLPSTADASAGGISFKILFGSKCDDGPLKKAFKDNAFRIRTLFSKTAGEVSLPKPISDKPEEDVATASIRSMTPTVRVDILKLDSLLNIVGELVLTKAVINQVTRELTLERGLTSRVAELQKATQALDRRIGELQEGLVDVRMIPVGHVFDRLVRIVRKVSRELEKEVDLRISGEETRLDKSMIEEIADPLMHLIRNSLDHGLEMPAERVKLKKPGVGTIHLRAMQRGNNVVIEVEDDGRGIDLQRVRRKGEERGLIERGKVCEEKDLLNLIFSPGFSTAEKVSEISGRGVGLDVVARNISRLSGMVDVDSRLGEGTRFSITLPITLIIIKALIVHVGSEKFAIPLSSVSESLMAGPADVRTVQQKEVMQLRSQTLSLLRIQDLFGVPGQRPIDEPFYVVVVGLAEKRIGLVVDAIEGQQEIVIKTLGDVLRNTPGLAGATELGDRRTILVLDIGALVEEATKPRTVAAVGPSRP